MAGGEIKMPFEAAAVSLKKQQPRELLMAVRHKEPPLGDSIVMQKESCSSVSLPAIYSSPKSGSEIGL